MLTGLQREWSIRLSWLVPRQGWLRFQQILEIIAWQLIKPGFHRCNTKPAGNEQNEWQDNVSFLHHIMA